MNPLATRLKILELEAELQRVSLAAKLQVGRQRPSIAWVLPMVGGSVGWLLRSRSKWLGLAWLVSRTLWQRRHKSASRS
jgi:hypothetical protein